MDIPSRFSMIQNPSSMKGAAMQYLPSNPTPLLRTWFARNLLQHTIDERLQIKDGNLMRQTTTA
jgi:hypothetical protein